MEVKEIKAAIKANFESLSFESAMEANKDLLAEYTNIKGERSAKAIVSYYRRKESTPAEVTEEPTSNVEEQSISAEEVGSIEDVVAPSFQFKIGEEIESSELVAAIENKDEALNKFCVVREYFEQVSDSETINKVEMFVERNEEVIDNGDGWTRWDDASAAAKDKGLNSYRKPGNFDLSLECLPVGEVYCKVTVMRISDALNKFYNRKNGIKCAKDIYEA